jgi:transposase
MLAANRLTRFSSDASSVIRHYKKGHKVMRIVELTGLSYPAVRSTIDRFNAGGLAALKPTPRGKKQGEGRSLTAAQEDKIRKLICDKRPERLKMDFVLWTRPDVVDRTRVLHQVIGARRWQLSQTLGLHSTKADPTRL